MKIQSITNTSMMYSHQSICDSRRLVPVACELLFRGGNGNPLQSYLDEPSMFISHMQEMVAGKASSILSLYDTHDYGIYFVNFTPDQIAESSFIDALAHFAERDIQASSVVIEVTELPLMGEDNDAFLLNVEMARNKGHLIAVDDFGAGSSNFNRVVELKPDIIKIDKDLLHLAGSSFRHKHALRALVSFIHEIGAKCIIEGVENDDLLHLARTSGADYLQGYHMSRPSLVVNSPTKPKLSLVEKVNPSMVATGYMPVYSF